MLQQSETAYAQNQSLWAATVKMPAYGPLRESVHKDLARLEE